MATIHDIDGNIIGRSRNLRNILDRSRDVGVASVVIRGPFREGGAGNLTVYFLDGTRGYSRFESWDVMRDWVRTRKNFQGAQLFNFEGCQGEITRDHPCLLLD